MDSIWYSILKSILTWITTAGVRIVIAIILLIISFRIIKKISKVVDRAADNAKYDKTLANVFAYVFKLASRVIVIVCLIGYVGIDTTGFTAVVASLGVGVGLALNGSLSNLAGGILIIVSRPFRVDDYIEALGQAGTVEDIHLTNTRIRTSDNKTVYLHNGALSAGTIVNYSEQQLRRVELKFTVDKEADAESAKKIILNVINAHSLVLKDKPIFVKISEVSDLGVTLLVRVWAKNEDYETVHYDIIENVKSVFDAAGTKCRVIKSGP